MYVELIDNYIKNSNDIYKRIFNLCSYLFRKEIEYHFEFVDDIINIYSFGESRLWLTAHYDVVNFSNCYIDNTTALFIIVELKNRYPDINFIYFDKEEPPYMGRGALLTRLLPKNSIILNLDVLGIGNDLIYDYNKNLELFDNLGFFKKNTPFCDTTVLVKRGYEAITISAIGKNLDISKWFYCHTNKDNIDIINDEYIISNIDKIGLVIEKILEGDNIFL